VTTPRGAAALVLAEVPSLFRAALVEALDAERDLEVVGVAGSGAEAHALVQRLRPELLLVAVHLDQRNAGLRLSRAVQDVGSPPHVLVLIDTQDATEILSALETGAVGTVSRDDRLDDVLRTVRAALRGEACVPRRLLGSVLGELIARRRRDDAVQLRYGRLSRREREVLALLAEGLDHTRIAMALVISPQTARTHIQNILEKLEVHSRVEAAGLALEHDLVGTEGG
jgi:two-component system nitrate/nitrite response regulator NarL